MPHVNTNSTSRRQMKGGSCPANQYDCHCCGHNNCCGCQRDALGRNKAGTCSRCIRGHTCEPCPPFSGTGAAGATSIKRCLCAAGYHDSDHHSPSSVTCLPCKTSCPKHQRLTGKCSAAKDRGCTACRDRTSCPAGTYLAGSCGGSSDYTCAPCPAHTTGPAGATEASQCTCATGYYDADTASLGVSCAQCRVSCGTGMYVSAKCGAVDAAHGQDATCTTCPAHSTLAFNTTRKNTRKPHNTTGQNKTGRTKRRKGHNRKGHNTTGRAKRRKMFGITGIVPPQIQDCVCDSGYYDDEPALSKVSCVSIPPQFGAGADKTVKCKWYKFGQGLKQQIELDMSPSNTRQLGEMVQFMKNVDTNILYSADFNNVCGTLMLQYSGTGSICSKQFALFGKTGNSVTLGRNPDVSQHSFFPAGRETSNEYCTV